MQTALLNNSKLRIKMKKIKLIYSLMVAMLIASSCTDFVEPAIPYNGFETGTYLKTIQTPAAINFFDLDNSPFKIKVECHALDKANNVKNVDVYVNHRRGNLVTKEVLLGSVDGSAFTTTADSKWPRADINFTMAQALSKLGFAKTNLKGGDFIEYRLVLTTLDGKTFSNNNMSPTLTEEYYKSPFFYRVAVVCPSALAGSYDYSNTDIKSGVGGTLSVCGKTTTGTVTLTAASVAGQYEISDATFGLFACLYSDSAPAGSLRFTDSCGKIGMSGTDKYGDAYSISDVVVDGAKLTYTWINTYGDGGRVTLTKKSGTWPSLN
jgi:hypothetical protein